MKAAILVLMAAISAFAGEYAVFPGGGTLLIDRHELAGSKVRLYAHGGWTEIEASEVLRFEPDGRVPDAPAPSATRPLAEPSPHQLVDAAAEKYGLPKRLLHSIVAAESAYRTDAVSPKGAIGLMQLMPATAAAYGADPSDPRQNVDAGARYFSDLLRLYGGYVWHALAAYNAGPGAVKKYQGIPPYAETQAYVARIDRNAKLNK